MSTADFWCYGHYADNEIILRDIFEGSEYITNAEMYLHLDPFNANATNYVYDEFDWNHCKELE